MKADLTIHSYVNNGPKGSRPRQPLVHLIYSDEYRDLQSLSFHPDDAARIADAINRAADAALRGRKIAAIKFDLKEQP